MENNINTLTQKGFSDQNILYTFNICLSGKKNNSRHVIVRSLILGTEQRTIYK